MWKLLTRAPPIERPRLPGGRRVYAVGDIHGRADLLSALLTRIDDDLKSRPTTDAVHVFLGDYIDRGPSSRQVIDLLIARRQGHDVVLLKGNHEDFAIRFLSDPTLLSQWQSVGGLDTILSYGVTPSGRLDSQTQQQLATAFGTRIADSHRRFLGSLALSFTCGDFFFVHAGVRPRIPWNSSASLIFSGYEKSSFCTRNSSARLWCTVTRPHANPKYAQTASTSIPALMRPVA